MILSVPASQAAGMRGMNKHDASIAHYNYSLPIVDSEAPGSGSLKDDLDSGKDMTAPATMDAQMPQGPSVALNAMATNFKLERAAGGSMTLGNALSQGPVLALFTRSIAMSSTNAQLQLIQKNMPQFKALGIQVIGVTPDMAATLQSAQQSYNFGFEVLSDPGGKVAAQYGATNTPSLFTIDATGKIIAIQMQSSNGAGFDLNEATSLLRQQAQEGAPQPAAAPMAEKAPMAGAAMAPPSVNKVANDPVKTDDAAPADPAVPNTAMPQGSVPKVSFEVPPSNPDFVKRMKVRTLDI